MGLPQAPTAEAKTQPENPVGTQGELEGPGQPGPELLSSIAKARLDMARRNINDILTIELDRLDAEDGLARSEAKLGAVSNTAKARLRTAKILRDVMCKRFEGGEIGAEDYLLWQKRYDDVADEVLAMTGGDVIRLL
jgi:hypothetical protein